MPSVVSDDSLIEIHPNPLPACFADSDCNANPFGEFSRFERVAMRVDRRRRDAYGCVITAMLVEEVSRKLWETLARLNRDEYDLYLFHYLTVKSEMNFRLRQAGKLLFNLFLSLSLSPRTGLGLLASPPFFPR